MWCNTPAFLGITFIKNLSSILCLYEKKKRCHSKWSCFVIWFMLVAHVVQYRPFLYSASSEGFLFFYCWPYALFIPVRNCCMKQTVWENNVFIMRFYIQGDYSFQICLQMSSCRLRVLHVYWIFIDRSAERRSEMWERHLNRPQASLESHDQF